MEHAQKTCRFFCNEWLQKGPNGLEDCKKHLFPGDKASKETTFKVMRRSSRSLSPPSRLMLMC